MDEGEHEAQMQDEYEAEQEAEIEAEEEAEIESQPQTSSDGKLIIKSIGIKFWSGPVLILIYQPDITRINEKSSLRDLGDAEAKFKVGFQFHIPRLI